MTKAFEVVQFSLRDGTDEQEFMKVAGEVQRDFLEKCAGFIDRELIKTTDGQWADVLHWETMKDAKKAAEDFPKNETARKYEKMIDTQSAKMMHAQVIRKF